MRLILAGRSGSGKSSVMESILGAPLSSEERKCNLFKCGSQLAIAESIGFFSEDHDLNSCQKDLVDCVSAFHPGPDAFGFVIRIGRFTPEEQRMTDLIQTTLGKDVFRFTIVIFTRLDDLLYDDVPLEKFIENSTPGLKNLLAACDGRYIAFDNTGSWKARNGYVESLISLIKTLQEKNNYKVYTVEMLEEAALTRQIKEQENLRKKEEIRKQMKEEMKTAMRHELQKQISIDIEDKLRKEEVEYAMAHDTQQMENKTTTNKYDDLGSPGTPTTSVNKRPSRFTQLFRSIRNIFRKRRN